LSHPPAPFDDDEPAAARASLGQRRLDPRQFLVPLKQRFGGHGHVHVPPAYSPGAEHRVCATADRELDALRKVRGVSTVRIAFPAFEDRVFRSRARRRAHYRTEETEREGSRARGLCYSAQSPPQRSLQRAAAWPVRRRLSPARSALVSRSGWGWRG